MSFITTIGNIFNFILDPVLGPLLALPPIWAVLIISLVITLITTLIYKKVTDQELMKTIKEDMKIIQKEMRDFKHDLEKVGELQKRMMQNTKKQFKNSMKPMLYTTLPMLIIFGWLWTNMAYEPINPNVDFSTTIEFEEGVSGNVTLIVEKEDPIKILDDATQNIEVKREKGWFFTKETREVKWNLNAEEGDYTLKYQFKKTINDKKVKITNKREYVEPIKSIKRDGIEKISINNQPTKIFGMGWLWFYIIVSIVFNMVLRKILKIH